MGIHKLPGEMTDETIREGWEGYCGKAKAAGITPISAVYSLEKGVAHCLTEAESAD